MRRVLITLLTVFLTVSKYSDVSGQGTETKNNWLQKHPIDFAVGNFSVGMPFSKIFINKFYPLATLGTEFYYRNKKRSHIYQTAKIGGYYNKYNSSAFFVNTAFGYRYSFAFGVFVDADLGVGYSQLFRPNALYKLNANEIYEQVRDWGKPSLMANYSLYVGYGFIKHVPRPVSFFLRYGNYVQLFYNPDIPALPQNSFQAGTRFLMHKNKK